MRKYIILRLIVVGLIASLLLVVGSVLLQLRTANQDNNKNSMLQLEQISSILQKNEEDLENLQQEASEESLLNAKAVSYILHNNPDYMKSIEQLFRIAYLLQIDEIHIFDTTGTIIHGNIPSYIGVDMYSGEQIGFFLPMLDNYKLELVQDITPNTASDIEMQYTAVWGESNEYIVQVGVRPTRLKEALKETDIDYILSRLVPAPGEIIYAVEKSDHTIISSSEPDMIGMEAQDILIGYIEPTDDGMLKCNTKIFDQLGQSAFIETDDYFIGLNRTNNYIYGAAFSSAVFIIASGCIVAALIILIIYFMLDSIVIKRMVSLNDGMKKIANGNLDFKMNVGGVPEFKELSSNVNTMVENLLEQSGRLSTIFKYVDIPIAIYECRPDRVIATAMLGNILELSKDNFEYYLRHPAEFVNFVDRIMSNPYQNESDVYKYDAKSGTRYLVIKKYSEQHCDWGIVHDVTQEIREKQSIKQERDIDFLTGIYNRRAFLEKVDLLIQTPNTIKSAILVMMDLDNLKYVNDTWGHAYGDDYICKAAEVLSSFDYENKLAARLSGDEFVIMLYGTDNEQQLIEQVKLLAQRYKEAYISNPEGDKFSINISGGYALFPKHSEKFSDVLHLADQAMYEVKRTGKGRFVGHVE